LQCVQRAGARARREARLRLDHVKWFIDPSRYPTDYALLVSPPVIAGFAFALAAVALAYVVQHRAPEPRWAKQLERYAGFGPLALGVFVGVALMAAALARARPRPAARARGAAHRDGLRHRVQRADREAARSSALRRVASATAGVERAPSGRGQRSAIRLSRRARRARHRGGHHVRPAHAPRDGRRGGAFHDDAAAIRLARAPGPSAVLRNDAHALPRALSRI